MIFLPVLLLGCLSVTADDPATACNEANEACNASNCGVGSATMLPGSNCMECHSERQRVDQFARRARVTDTGDLAAAEHSDYGRRRHEVPQVMLIFSVAGTLFAQEDGEGVVSGAIVRFTDSAGTSEELVTNSSGNFYTQTELVFPIVADVTQDGTTTTMTTPQMSGECNSCHACTGEAGGKLTPG